MTTTVETKRAQLENGFYQTGSGPETILIVGSCRTMAYISYLARYNESAGQPFRICFIDPFNFLFSKEDDRILPRPEFEELLHRLESDERILGVISSASIFIHEWYDSYEMFNCDLGGYRNIYQFGLAAKLDICIPNFHDHFVLATEQATYDAQTHEAIEANGGQPSAETMEHMKQVGLAHVEKFCGVCHKSSIPDFANYFKNWWRVQRMFWTGNHVSANFTLNVFRMINDQYLRLPLSEEFWHEASKEDLFRNPHTPLTSVDVDMYGISWPEPIVPFKLP